VIINTVKSSVVRFVSIHLIDRYILIGICLEDLRRINVSICRNVGMCISVCSWEGKALYYS
jgi:hypothetical protein